MARAKKVAAKAAPRAANAVADKPKQKRVHGKFSLPADDYALIAKLKSTMKIAGRPVKKNDLFRVGLRALRAMPDAELKAAVGALALTGPAPRKK